MSVLFFLLVWRTNVLVSWSFWVVVYVPSLCTTVLDTWSAPSLEKAQELQAAGITQAQARQLFQEAQLEVPRIQELQARGGRQVDDVFGIEDFTEAAVFRSPEELEEVRVLEAEEASRFTPTTGPARRGRRVQGLVQE